MGHFLVVESSLCERGIRTPTPCRAPDPKAARAPHVIGVYASSRVVGCRLVLARVVPS
jgi:hypothetical protein